LVYTQVILRKIIYRNMPRKEKRKRKKRKTYETYDWVEGP
jgi:hypothetical protein